MADILIRRGYEARIDLMIAAPSGLDNGQLLLAGDAGKFEFAAAASGGRWSITIDGQASSGLLAGDYIYELSAGALLLDSGRAKVVMTAKADGEAALAANQAWEQKALAAVEAVLLDASASADISISIEGKSYGFESRADLMEFRAHLRHQCGLTRRSIPVASRRRP